MTDPKRRATRTGGRDAIEGVIKGRYSLSVGNPETPAPDGWKWTLLRDVARLESGHTPSRRKPEYWGGDIPWIGIRDATGNHGRTLLDTQQHTNQLGIDHSSARVLPANTVCLSRTASVGYVVVMGVPMATSQDFVNWVCSPDIDYRFLKYVLLAEHETYLSFASGTTHQTIYYPEVKAFHVCLPPVEVQRRIADVLQSFDDLIENNRRRVKVLQEMARAVYREWFVHFRFPGHEDATFADSDLGPIPEGWRASTCGAELDFVGGGTPSKKEPTYWDEGTVDWFTPSDLTKTGLRYPTKSELQITEAGLAKSSAKLVPPGTVMMTSRATLGVLAITTGPACTNQGFISVLPDCRWPAHFVREFLDESAEDLAAIGTGATFKEITKGAFKTFPFLVPEQSVLDKYRAATADAELLVASLEHAGARLAALRDMLLPKLVTGQLNVSDLDLDSVVKKAGV